MDFSVFFAIAVVIGIVSVLTSSRQAGAWKTAARELGLNYSKKGALSPPRIEGVVDGMPMVIEVKGSGNSRTTRYRCGYTPLGLDLKIGRTTGLTKISEFLGAQDAETGDRSFDDRYNVKTSDPDRLAEVLTPQVRRAVEGLFADLPSAKVGDDQIAFSRRGVETKAGRMVRTARVMLAAGQTIARRDRASERRVESHFDDAPPVLLPPDPFSMEPPHQAPGPYPDMPGPSEPVQEQEADKFVLDSPASDFEEQQGDDSVLDSSSSLSDDVSTPATDSPALGPDPLEVAGALFDGSLLSFQIATLFQEQYAGRSIRWQGVVAERTEEGVRVDLGALNSRLYGQLMITALVAAGGGFRPGDAVVVAGTLAGVDAFERTFAVDGVLEHT